MKICSNWNECLFEILRKYSFDMRSEIRYKILCYSSDMHKLCIQQIFRYPEFCGNLFMKWWRILELNFPLNVFTVILLPNPKLPVTPKCRLFTQMLPDYSQYYSLQKILHITYKYFLLHPYYLFKIKSFFDLF